MKAFEPVRLFPVVARLLTISALLAGGTTFTLHARHDDDDSRHEFERKILLTATEVAPSNAIGVAELEVGHPSLSRSNRIEVETRGLLPGVYTVTLYDRSGSLSVVLGTLSVGNEDDDDEENERDGNHGNRRGRGGDDDEGEATFPVPNSMSVMDMGLLSITDAAGLEVLKGDFSDLGDAIRGHFRVRVPVVAGEAAPDVSGRAEIKGNASRGRGHGNLRVDARGLPASSTFVLFLNDVEVDTVRTDRRGRLRLHRNHRSIDVFSISTISLRDESGAEVASASF